MVTKLIRAVSYFTGNFDQPIRLEILATGAGVNVDPLTLIGFMRIGGYIFAFYSPTLHLRPWGYKTFLCSTPLIMKFMLINVKMPTIIGILTVIRTINTIYEHLKARKVFGFYEQLKFHAQLSWTWKSSIANFIPRFPDTFRCALSSPESKIIWPFIEHPSNMTYI